MDSQKEKLLEESYDLIVNVGFCLVPYQDISDIVDPGMMLFGTTKDEKIFSLNELIDLFKSQYQQMERFEPSVERKRLYTHISDDDNSAVIAEEITLTLVSEEITNSLYLRTSCVMQYSAEQWKVTHWHASTPVETENDHWHMEEWKREKEKLQKLVDEQTADLKNKNRELEIEAALEKVRAVAMGMKKPEDMLDVCRVISDQLQQFGVTEIRNVQLAIIDENIGQYLCYQYFTPYDKTAVEKTEYLKSPVEHGMVKQMLASKDGHFTGTLEGKELKKFREHRKTENHFPDPFLDKVTKLDYCFLSIGEGGLGLTLYQPMAEDILNLFKRFHQVFSLAYQRFREIQKAEAQAREAQIEVAVERVRAQSMAMHHPDDLDKVNKEILTQLNWLQIEGLSGVTFYLVDQDGWVKAWDFSSPGNIGNQNSYTLQFDFKKYEMMGYPFKILQQTDLNYFIADYPFEKLEKAVSEIEEINPEVANAFKEALTKGILTHQWSACARITEGLLGVDLVSPPSEDTKTIVLKIAGAFNQAYQRFLDLQKAEALAREAQIEAALERVRAQTMAMHSSEDVGKCVVKMFSELTALGVDEGTRFGIGILNHENENNQLWTARKTGEEVNMHIGNIDMAWHPMLMRARQAWLEQVPFHKYVLEGEGLLSYYRMLNQAPDYKIQIPIEKLPKKEIQHCFIFEHGFFYAFSPREFQPELIQITKRFSSLFEQTYRRYLDLVKAESQAREAEIELALERVRARTMAMHHTEELKEVIQVVFDQFVDLNIHVDHAGFILDYKEREDMHIWLADHQQGVPTEITIPYFDSPHWNSYREAKTKEESFFANLLPFEVKNKFYRDLFELIPELTEEAQQAIFNKPALAISTVLLDNVGLYIEHYSMTPYTAEENAILMRFGKVFQQTYTRFLDLQKAEAQARESQIQLAMERVRARTMAMQHSSELGETSALLFQQIQTLGVPPWACGFNIWEQGDTVFTSYMGSPDGAILEGVKIPLTEEATFIHFQESRDRGDKLFVDVLEGETLDAHYRYFLTLPGIKEAFEKRAQAGEHRPTFQINHLANFSHGNLMFITYEPCPEAHDIFIRFAKVFEQTYTRFLDLQKAEAQAREAQIEAALEKVRSRSLAMHKSGELKEVVSVLFGKLKDLQIPFTAVGIATNIEGSKDLNAFVCGQNEAGLVITNYRLPYFDNPVPKDLYGAIEEQLDYFVGHYSKEEKDAFYNYVIEHTAEFRHLPEDIKRMIFDSTNYTISMVAVKNAVFNVNDFEGKVLAKNEIDIIQRFVRVFDQAYTRFLDLQKAEAQAREAEIQLALERVRAKTMAMKTQSDLLGIIELFGEQLSAVGIRFDNVTFIEGPITKKRDWELWSYAPEAENTTDKILIPYIETPYFTKTEKAVKEYQKTGQPIQVKTFTKKEKNEFLDHYWKHAPAVSDEFVNYVNATPGSIIVDAFLEEITVSMVKWNAEPYTDEELEIFERFAKEFRQTYIRFLDIKKAEAQVREAKIETSLEKVRSRTMGMQNSDELAEVANVLFAEMNDLVYNLWTCGFVLCEKSREEDEWWLSLEDGFSRGFFLPNVIDYAHSTLYEGWLEGDSFRTVQLEGDKLQEHYDWLMEIPVAKNIFDDMEAAGMQRPEWQKLHAAYFSKGYLVIITTEPCPEEEIFKRFAKVFDQTYTRFLDLQKAEAQARESKIETALEKVRSRTMGMQSSEELPEVANLLFTEVRSLGIPAWSCGYNILAEDKKTATAWMSSEGIMQTPFQLRLFGEASFDEMGEFILSDHTMFVQELGGQALEDHYAYMKTFPDLKSTFENIEAKGFSLPTYQINHLCKFNGGFILFITYEKVTDAHAIFKRFTIVFDQTYTRFLDLKKAEAQAREAQIEAALEKVRSRSLAMQSPDELIEVAQLLREEMGALGVEELETSSIYIQDESTGLTQCWFTIKNPDNPNKAITDQMTIALQDTWVGRKMLDFYRSSSNQTSILMQGEQRIEWIRYCEEKTDLFGISNFYGETIPDRTYHLYKFSNGYIGAAAPGEISSESWELLKRATAVFSFAYTRFRDLQMAQASARTAMRQASLDRVRADISSMRNAVDLDRITPLIFKELTVLGVPFIRCGVFIIQEKQKIVEAYLSSPEGNSLGVLRLPYKASELTYQTVKAWRKGEVLRQHWNKEDFVQWINQLMEQDQIQNGSTYQGTAAPPESLDLHFVPFDQGMLYVGAVSPLEENELELVQALAKAFSIAYARYEDFVKLEQAKTRVESAMTELKATQSQLVQQEKLASLGQLTAGIAHEIKNPLNFVNNFSEVSIEMIEEIIDSRYKTQDARLKTEADEIEDEILEDIKANLKKIHEHGSRANGIVTSMLQHSRGGSGKKEPTDLNALIKEYVNLSFHGMRAGKNPINVDIQLVLDTDLGKVSLIKEDFTRVVINLCNNAFDAMREKVKKYEVRSTEYNDRAVVDGNYLPKLKVTTMLEKGWVRLSLEDNGPGIPDEIKDKIFQPFFTTKKGTEGTGLGLSITHDIVKAHGGELEIETAINKGTSFIIKLSK
ncbi:ATP-binding protein [Belliella aquatica]|uniref:histidine kinase n=1 Tax=Belliella aquatica TaxID=1323734 RepID=A0ABQ1LK47_9BACT|nr:ATP-binding protein [Belliella aquatica]MCH7404149.1 ATP-binding protein [Belliella aquatica]GGC25728.1 hypothetical protein GCM10010993_01000 [Belliella aquatica]